MPPTPKKAKAKQPREVEALTGRAASRGYTLEQDEDGNWYAEIHGTKWGPMATLEELDEFLPNE